MTKERELLRRMIGYLDYSNKEADAFAVEVEAFLDEAYLAAEPEAEPYAWAWDEIMSGGLEPVADMDRPVDNEYRTNIRPLFLHPPRPEPARKPMTEEEIIKLWRVKHGKGFWGHFLAGFRSAEKHHGITED